MEVHYSCSILMQAVITLTDVLVCTAGRHHRHIITGDTVHLAWRSTKLKSKSAKRI